MMICFCSGVLWDTQPVSFFSNLMPVKSHGVCSGVYLFEKITVGRPSAILKLYPMLHCLISSYFDIDFAQRRIAFGL